MIQRALQSERADLADTNSLTSLPNNHHRQNRRGGEEVEWDHDESRMERSGPLQHAKLRDQEDDDGKSTCNARCDKPSGEDLADTLPTPIDAATSQRCNADADNAADDGMAVFC